MHKFSIPKIFQFGHNETEYDFPAPCSFGGNFPTQTVHTAMQIVDVSFLSLHLDLIAIAFYYLHYIFNDFVVLILNLVIDIKLVLCIRKNLRQKLKAKQKECDQSFSLGPGVYETKLKKLAENLKKKNTVENKANALIITNVAIYIVCRLPELAGALFFPLSKLVFSHYQCNAYKLCFLIYNSTEYLYMISYAFPILICYHFNSNFQTGFKNIFKFKSKTKL